MGWPYDPCLWRDGAVPAKKTYAAVAKTISQFEPVTMLADPAVSGGGCWLLHSGRRLSLLTCACSAHHQATDHPSHPCCRPLPRRASTCQMRPT